MPCHINNLSHSHVDVYKEMLCGSIITVLQQEVLKVSWIDPLVESTLKIKEQTLWSHFVQEH